MISRLVQSGCRRYGLSIMTVETRATDSYIKTISMKAYLITTGIVFGLITVAHVWRVFAEGSHLATDPVFILLTLLSTALCLWACRLLRVSSRS